MINVTVRQIEYATATARLGGVTAAANSLNISQPALSVALAQLESALGQPLFLRRPGGRVVPTSFGAGWLAAAQVQLDGLASLMTGPAPTAPVRLAVQDDLAPAILAPILRQLSEHHPDLRHIAEILPFAQLSEGVRLGKIDLALTWDMGLAPNSQCQVLAQVPPLAVMAVDHPLAKKRRSITLAELAGQPLIVAEQGHPVSHFRALFAAQNLTPAFAHRLPTLDLMRSFAANGLGIGLGYGRPAWRRSHDGQKLAAFPVTDAGAEPLVLARMAENPLSSAAQKLAALLPSLLPAQESSDTLLELINGE